MKRPCKPAAWQAPGLRLGETTHVLSYRIKHNGNRGKTRGLNERFLQAQRKGLPLRNRCPITMGSCSRDFFQWDSIIS